MPQLFKIGSYIVYFWSNEGMPLEPVHVHVASGTPTQHGTKIWITEDGRALLSNNNSRIPRHTLTLIMRVIEANSESIVARWDGYFSSVSYYC